MALVLALAPNDDFYVQDEQFVLHSIQSQSEFVLQRADKTLLSVRDGRSYPLTPTLRVSVGARGQLAMARVALEGPRSTIIMRGDRYRDNKAR